MIQRTIFSLVSVFSVSALLLAVGCAAPTAGDEDGTTSQDLTSTAAGSATKPGPSTSAGGGGVTNPLCVEHHIHSNVCIYDWELKAEAETICGKDRLIEYTIDDPCLLPATAGGEPSTAAANGEPSTAAANVDLKWVHPIPSATKVSFACCNVVVDPTSKATSAAGL